MVPEGALMIVLIIFTTFFHLIINNSYSPVIKYLPAPLTDMTKGGGGAAASVGGAIRAGAGARARATASAAAAAAPR